MTDIQMREALKKIYGPKMNGLSIDRMSVGQVTAIYMRLKRTNKI